MNRIPYTIEQLRALLAAAESRWNAATVADAGQWKHSVHALRDRIVMQIAIAKVAS